MTKFYRETQFKDTEIGRIPSDWKVVRLGEVVKKVKSGGTPKTTVKEYYENGTIPFVKIEDLTTNGKYLKTTILKITVDGLKNSSAWLVPPNSLLFSMYGSYGEVSINKIEVATNQAILGIIPDFDKVDIEFLYYWFSYYKPKWYIYTKTTTQSNLTKQIVENGKIPLPPIEEQRAIAGVLRQFDELVEVIDKKIESLQRIKKGLMDIYFTRGVFEHREFKETEIGRIPEDWEVVRLGKFIKEFVRGVSYTKSESALKNRGGFIPLLRATNLGDEKLIMENLIYVIANQVNSKQLIRKGDIVITTSSGSKYMVGRAIRVREEIKEPIAIGAFLAILRFNDAIDNEFAYYIFKSHIYRRYLNILVAGTNINNLKREYIYNFTIPLPPIEEQKEIARRLKDVDDQIKNLREQGESVERMKKRVMDLLLTGKVRVKEVR